MPSIVRLLVALLPAALVACGGGTLTVTQANLRLVNATNEFAGLDLYAGGDAAVTGVASFGISGYAGLVKDTYTLDVHASGSSTTLVSTSTTLDKKDHQTVVAYTSAGTLTTAVLSDNESDPSSGNAKIRIFNTASADAGSVDVYLVGTDCSGLAASAAAPLATGVSGLQSTYTSVTSSGTPVHVCVTAPGDKTDLRLDIPALTLSEKRILTLVLVRGPGGVLLNGLLLDQQGALTTALNTSARVRVAASLSPAAAISVDVNATPVVAGLATPNIGPYVLVPAGTLALKINGAAFTTATPLVVAPGSDVTLLITGSTPTVTSIPDDNTVSSSTARPVKLRLVNGLNGTSTPTTLTVDNAIVGAGSTAFLAASTYSLLPPSAAIARIEARTGVVQVYLGTGVTLSAGRVYSLFVLGDFSQAPNTGILVADR